MDIEWRAGRQVGTEIPISDRGKPRRPGGESGESHFPHLLTEAGRQYHAAVNEPDITSSDGGRTTRTVRRGDTLSQMVQSVLRQAGQRVHRGELYHAVDLVARTNQLTDPDRLRPGQVIDLSAVVPGMKTIGTNMKPGHDGGGGGISDSVSDVMRGLKSFMQSFAGRFTSSFGPRADPITGSQAFHAGVDIKMPSGSLIYPALPGRVIFSGRTHGYGNLIILEHTDGFTTSYGHNTSNLIPAGVSVDREMPIALVGATGRATGPHLHFEVRRHGHPIDPDGEHLES